MKYCIFILSFLCSNLNAQDTIYARKIINELCGAKYKGRGYVGAGDKKAANFIQKQFKQIGLKKVEGSYVQKFQFPINTFPKTVEVKYNGKLLSAGIDYVINAGCKTIQATYFGNLTTAQSLNDSSYYDKYGYKQGSIIIDTFTKKYMPEAFVTNQKIMGDFKKEIIIKLTNDKLTWTADYQVDNNCIITLKSSVFDRNKPGNFEISIKNKFFDRYTSQNILGMLEGTEKKDSFVFLTAHYDHLGMMGKTAMFPGANDNASGIAMMINLAKYFKANPPRYSIIFIAFGAEEVGLIGSKYYVEQPIVPLAKIEFLINIDLMGNGADGVMAVNGSLFKSQFDVLSKINSQNNYLPSVKLRGKAANSDHYWFSEARVPCFFFYLMGPYPYYHDVNDKAAAVSLTNFSNAFLLFKDFMIALQNNPE